ncbi:MAG: hypothetical protein KTR30_21725 [Saprospiraceae bacterium]|nr:hypothetical protein [Saprospiraceae bacterium]
MLRLLRSRRRKSFQGGKVRKYFLYVLGEVILIVLGIVIGVRLSNWNEAGKQRTEEVKLLKEIRADLGETADELRGDLSSHQRALQSGMIFNQALRNYSKFHDSLYYHFERCLNDRQLYPKTGGYETMKSYGVDIISNDKLRKGIMDVHQLGLKRVTEFGQATPKYDLANLLKKHQDRHFQLTDEIDRKEMISGVGLPVLFYHLKLLSFEALKRDQEFLMDLQRSFNIRRQKIGRHLSTLEEIEQLVLDIDQELQ